MADVTATLRRALGQLEVERERIDRQIAALRSALGSRGGGRRRGRAGGTVAGRKRRRRQFTAAQKKEVSRRMKAYWAKRRAEK